MVDEDRQYEEGLIGLLIFNLIISFVTLSAILGAKWNDALTAPDGYQYLQFPEEDFFMFVILFPISIIFHFYFFIKVFNIRISENLNYREGDKYEFALKVMSFNVPYTIHFVLLFILYIKYVNTSLGYHLTFSILFELFLITLIYASGYHYIQRRKLLED